MINKYLDFINENVIINEGSSYNPSVIYWKENVDKVLYNNWSNISISNIGGRNSSEYCINFIIDNDNKDNYYKAIIEDNGKNDLYYMEDPEPFIEKFKKEFLKNPLEYIEHMDYDPKALGDLRHIRNSNKFNL